MRRSPPSENGFPLDLHVLGLPPAFVLSQDQTLRLTSAKLNASNPLRPRPKSPATGSLKARSVTSFHAYSHDTTSNDPSPQRPSTPKQKQNADYHRNNSPPPAYPFNPTMSNSMQDKVGGPFYPGTRPFAAARLIGLAGGRVKRFYDIFWSGRSDPSSRGRAEASGLYN